MQRDSMTVREACAYLRVHRSTIYKLLQRAEIPHFRVGTELRFSAEALDRWLGRDPDDPGSAASWMPRPPTRLSVVAKR
ncbi:MAG: helix-turn-helix domain-containing protein [Candidatus Binataceae bacterium]